MDYDVKSVLNKEQEVDELGVSFKYCQSNHSNAPRLQAKSKRFSVKLKLYREFALATLSALAHEKKRKPSVDDGLSQVHALDAYSYTGVAALQWKKLLYEDVHVTAADHEDVCLIKQNAEKNVITCLPWELDPKRVPGDRKKDQTNSEIFLCQADARALMAMESFNFIYLVPHKSNSSCLEPAFHSLSMEGVLCLVVPDLSVFARAPHVVRRTFSSQVIKTEYLKEMAARVVLAEAARSAAKHNKGISVLYVVSQEDFLLIAVRVHRGQKAVDSSLDNVAHLLHCRFCEERTFLPNQLAPIDNPYSLLSCSCKSTNVGKTAVILGPMWSGCIFSTDFLELVKGEGKKLGLGAKFSELTSLLLAENECPSSVEVTPEEKLLDCVAFRNGNSRTIEENQSDKLSQEQSSMVSGLVSLWGAANPIETVASGDVANKQTDQQDHRHLSGKRQSETELMSSAKRQKLNCHEEIHPLGVPFYYNIKKLRATVTHKLNKLVTILRSKGHRASRTHFDPCAIRTSASVPQFLQIMD